MPLGLPEQKASVRVRRRRDGRGGYHETDALGDVAVDSRPALAGLSALSLRGSRLFRVRMVLSRPFGTPTGVEALPVDSGPSHNLEISGHVTRLRPLSADDGESRESAENRTAGLPGNSTHSFPLAVHR